MDKNIYFGRDKKGINRFIAVVKMVDNQLVYELTILTKEVNPKKVELIYSGKELKEFCSKYYDLNKTVKEWKHEPKNMY